MEPSLLAEGMDMLWRLGYWLGGVFGEGDMKLDKYLNDQPEERQGVVRFNDGNHCVLALKKVLKRVRETMFKGFQKGLSDTAINRLAAIYARVMYQVRQNFDNEPRLLTKEFIDE